MVSREDYEKLELDVDGNYYYVRNTDFANEYKEPKLKDFLKWWDSSEKNEGFFYKGTALYFTLRNKKYWLSWTFYNRSRLEMAINKLKKLGAVNIQLNYGELD